MNNTHAVKLLLLAAMTSVAACNSQSSSQEAGADSTKVPAFAVNSIDSTFKPCDDFDEFANGNWKKDNPIPSTESRWGAFNVLDKENKEVRLKGIIGEITAMTDLKKGTEEQQIADYYRSFLDTVTIEKLGISPLQPYLDKINAAKTLAEWSKISGELQKFGVTTFAVFNVDADARNSSMNALYEFQAGLSLHERSYYDRTDSNTVNVRK